MLIYIVQIDYKEFSFTDPMSAMSFAETAMISQIENYDIKLKVVKKESEKENASYIDNEI